MAVAVCGTDTGITCAPTLNLKALSLHELVDCLKEKFPSSMNTTVTFKLTFPQDNFANLNYANFNASLGQPRFLLASFMAKVKTK